ncbi:MAG: hypothetical protein ACRAVC_23780 [Trichormus sp.]
MAFSDLVEAIKCLSLAEKQELQFLLQQYLREERREEIYQHYQTSKTEEKNHDFKFSSHIDELKRMIEDL